MKVGASKIMTVRFRQFHRVAPGWRRAPQAGWPGITCWTCLGAVVAHFDGPGIGAGIVLGTMNGLALGFSCRTGGAGSLSFLLAI